MVNTFTQRYLKSQKWKYILQSSEYVVVVSLVLGIHITVPDFFHVYKSLIVLKSSKITHGLIATSYSKSDEKCHKTGLNGNQFHLIKNKENMSSNRLLLKGESEPFIYKKYRYGRSGDNFCPLCIIQRIKYYF